MKAGDPAPHGDWGVIGRDGRELPPEAEIPGSGTPGDDIKWARVCDGSGVRVRGMALCEVANG